MYSKALAANSLFVGLVQVIELAPGVGHTADFGNAVAEPGLVASVIITDQLAPPVTQEGSGVFACTAGCEVVNSCLQVGKRCGAVGPDVGLVGFLLARGQHADRGFIGMQNTVFQQSISQRIHQRLQLHTTGTHPFGQGGARDFQAGTAEHAFLTVQRQMVGILGHQHLGQQASGGDAFVDHLRWHRCLDQRLAAVAGPFAPDVTFNGGHCCKVSDEAAFCLIQRPYISKTLLTRRISPRGSP